MYTVILSLSFPGTEQVYLFMAEQCSNFLILYDHLILFGGGGGGWTWFCCWWWFFFFFFFFFGGGGGSHGHFKTWNILSLMMIKMKCSTFHWFLLDE